MRTIQTITTSSNVFNDYYISSPFKLTDITNDFSGLELRVVEIVNGREGLGSSRAIDVSKAAIIPLISSTKPLLCSSSESSELSVTNAESNVLYSWSNGTTGVKTSVSGAGVYSVTAQPSSAGGGQACPSVKSQDISIQALTFDPEIIKPETNAKCQGESITLSVDPKGNGTFTYVWSKDGQTVGQEQMIEAKQSGVYTVNVKPNGTNCEAKNASNTITLTFDEPIVDAKISSTDDKKAICGAPEQPSLELVAMPNNLIYSWTRDGKDLGTSTQKITITEGGRYEVRLTKGGCKATQNIDIVDNNFDPGIADTPLLYCSDSPITLKAKTDDNQLYDYSWKQNDVSVGTNSSTLTLPAEPGSFKYRVETVAKNSGCKKKISQELTISSDPAIINPTITPNPAIICNKAEGLILSATADNSAGISYVWTGNGNAGSDPSKFVVYDAGTYAVTFQRGACKEVASVSPREEILAVNLTETGNSSPILLCGGENNVPVQLKAESNLSTATIKWYRQNGTEAPGTNTGNSYTPTETGTYYATAQFNTCTAKSAQTISTELVASFSTTILPENITPFCEDKSIQLEARPSRTDLASRLTYTWFQDGNTVKTGSGSLGSSLTTGRKVKYTGNSLAERPEADFTVVIAIDGCKATSPVKKVALKPSRMSIIVLDGNTLEATESVDNAYQWYYKEDFATSPEDTIKGYEPEAGATSRILMGAKRGSYFVRANRNECGVKNSLAYVVDAITAINPEEEREWKVYPNPAQKTITVEQVLRNISPATIELRNTGGQLLRQNRQLKSIENYSLDNLPAGVYFLEISQGSRIINKKFVKQ
ncbi:T9SS type A sorting domain-containing protein [Dyadobacter sp. CY261]|uniref:T9SS type A sorting domain-containing protein n=1 Tax=Dyadobacter sp. CY261 TaxID=2907203 RepID=UPI001F3255FA|nr:T9SS type A sorting domain-containing protein [Dyadobacter sp. CY261]MCF0075081.1 T9SS type A sorting domain-containing protein [Dyadobacter sp. CY261]